jgi:hypothetical protein
MIKQTAIISQKSHAVFLEAIEEHIHDMQAKRLIVEVQYSPVVQPDGTLLITALLLGRETA